MKREEIEQLLAEYTNGEISAVNKQRLEELFKHNATLKAEADEMAVVWQSFKDIADGEQPGAEMDKQFYAMLQNVKAGEPKGARIIQISTAHIKTAAAIAACLAMFVIGRYTVTPVAIVKYKTVVVKQPVINAPEIKPEPVPAVGHHTNKTVKPEKEIGTDDNNSELARQLRSVFASERIDAVVKLSAQKELNQSDLKLLELALQEDPNPNVRLMVINSFRPLMNRQNVQQVLISGLNHQDDLLVQSSLVDLLVSAKSKQAIPQMVTLLDNKNTDVMVQNKIKSGIESFLN